MPFSEEAFFQIWLACVVVVGPLWLWIVDRSRKVRGQPMMPRCPPGTLFCERQVSGQARGWLGGANKALLVAVTDSEVWITPTFPFTLVGPHGVFGLDHRVPRSEVVRAEPMTALFGENVLLELPGRPGRRNAELRLKLRDPEGFLTAIRR